MDEFFGVGSDHDGEGTAHLVDRLSDPALADLVDLEVWPVAADFPEFDEAIPAGGDQEGLAVVGEGVDVFDGLGVLVMLLTDNHGLIVGSSGIPNLNRAVGVGNTDRIWSITDLRHLCSETKTLRLGFWHFNEIDSENGTLE